MASASLLPLGLVQQLEQIVGEAVRGLLQLDQEHLLGILGLDDAQSDAIECLTFSGFDPVLSELVERF